MRLCFLAPLLLIVSPEGSFRVLRRPLPLRLQSLGQQPCLGHVRPHLAQSVRLIGGALIATGLEPSDPPVEVREAAAFEDMQASMALASRSSSERSFSSSAPSAWESISREDAGVGCQAAILAKRFLSASCPKESPSFSPPMRQVGWSASE